VTLAILLETRRTVSTFSAGVDKATHTGVIADREFCDSGANFGDNSRDFVTRHHGEDCSTPFFTGLVDVRMTDTREFYVNQNIVGSQIAAFNGGGF
jgi:hypothetical protein|tara:strand:+ start:236 stop:523 length:288 start_codon:yes stop_codon:yes gene_type:complete